MEINWIVVAVTFVVGAIAAYLIFGSKKKTPAKKKADLPSADLLDSDDKATSESNVQNEAGTFSQIERLEKPCKVEPRIIQFSLDELKSDAVKSGEKIVVKDVKIQNNSTMMGVFKVRTNRRKRYVVSPSVAFLKPSESMTVKITFRAKEVDSVLAENEAQESNAGGKVKKDTFLVQWMSVKDEFYYSNSYFDQIPRKAWIEKASVLIKEVEKQVASKERKKYFNYEKIYVGFQ